MALLGLAISPLAGTLIDRVGARQVLMVALMIEAVGVALYATVTTVPQAFAVATVSAIGGAAIWPAQSSLVAHLTDEAGRQRAFGVQFMLLNLGLGIGGLVGATIVSIQRPETFVTLYLIDAATYLLYIGVLLFVRAPRPSAEVTAVESAATAVEASGYRAVVSDRRLRRVALTGIILVTFGYGSMEGGLAVYMTQVAGLPVSDIGIVFAVNTGVIVAVQWWVIKRTEGRSRSALLATVGLLWAVSWAVMGSSALLAAGLALAALCVGMAVFALAETLWSPVYPALLNQLAPDHLRGRYNAVGSWGWSIAGAIGPAVAGGLIGAGHGTAWVVLLVVGCLGGALLARALRGMLTEAQDGRTPEPAAVGGSEA
jgi:MFS family permease